MATLIFDWFEHNNLVKHGFFRQLSDDEIVEFEKSARSNYKAGEPIETVWHPIYVDECVKINEENGIRVFGKRGMEGAGI